MTWIVKGTGDYAYVSHPDGGTFARGQVDAHRHESRSASALVARRLNQMMKEGLPYRVVRLRPRHVRLPIAAAKALQAAFMGDRFDIDAMNTALGLIAMASDSGGDQ